MEEQQQQQQQQQLLQTKERDCLRLAFKKYFEIRASRFNIFIFSSDCRKLTYCYAKPSILRNFIVNSIHESLRLKVYSSVHDYEKHECNIQFRANNYPLT